MTDVNRKDDQLRNLAFELEEIRESKFLICVCENEQEADKIFAELARILYAGGRATVSIPVSLWNLKGSLVEMLVASNKDSTADVIHLRSINRLPLKVLDRFFAELNFQRDTLARLGVPLVLWLDNKSLQRLVSQAPDFWSRRHAVYKFDTVSVDALLSRLFESRLRNANAADIDKGVSDALSEILGAERELQACLQRKSQFSLTKADNLISTIRKGLGALCTACNNGKQIEIALWLWNLSRLEEQLQQAAEQTDEHVRAIYEALYADRNEALLYMADHITDVLKKYGNGLEESIRKRHLVSIANSYVETVFKKLRKLVEALRDSDLNVSLDQLIDHGFDAYQTDYRGGGDLRARAAGDLEMWLSGEDDRRPAIFSEEEGSLLKSLYLGTGEGPPAEAGVGPQDLQRKIAELERKVRLYLGMVRGVSGGAAQRIRLRSS